MQQFLSKLARMALVLLCLFFHQAIHAQKLERNIFLGAQLSELSQVQEDTGTDSGLYLGLILPEGSLGQLGVPEGTVLKSVNGKAIKSITDLRPALAGLKAGDQLEVGIFQDKDLKFYSGTASGRLKEEHPNASVEYGQVDYKDNSLRSLLYLPNNVKQPPVVFFIQGYTCQTIEMQNDNPAKQLVDGWIANGYAVYMVEKPGVGDSESAIPCRDIDFNQEFMGFSQAYEELRSNNKVDTDQIFIFGHSLGGIIAPLLDEIESPAGIMAYGITGMNWYDYNKLIYTEQAEIRGESEAQIESNKKYYLPFLKDFLVEKKTNTELLSSSLYGDILRQDGVAESLSQGYFIQRHYKFWQTISDVDIPAAWSKVKTPVYILHGEYDIQAINPKYGEMIVTNVNEHNGNGVFEMFPKSEHAFLKFESREALWTTMTDGSYVSTFRTHFNNDISVKSIEWMNSLRK